MILLTRGSASKFSSPGHFFPRLGEAQRGPAEQKAAAACDGTEILQRTGPGAQQSLGTSVTLFSTPETSRNAEQTEDFGRFFFDVSWHLEGATV